MTCRVPSHAGHLGHRQTEPGGATWSEIRSEFGLVVAVNSLADADNGWGTQQKPPNVGSMLIRATSAPIDRYSDEQMYRLCDMDATASPG